MEGGAGGELSERFQSLEEDYIDCKRTINNSIHDLSSSDRIASDQLEQSKRIVQETEHIGISVMDTLAQQRETLLSAHDKVKDTRETAGDARRVLQRMSQRVLTHKLTLWFVIVVLVVAIALVFYHNFIRRA
ncbi:hypothetical protein B5M09_009162 [Aphanomyces astaci]|uniref:t-SNARE coiled-coil homology domain-containing protein n=1 Tax=Aphanomyces astaci TaxID=112090 RepID=A0A425D3Z1_APHAT|nr:hypothetical protein B5M09_009162 [Aphanomyces astaci]